MKGTLDFPVRNDKYREFDVRVVKDVKDRIVTFI